MFDKKSWKLLYWVIPSIAMFIVGLLVTFPPEWEWLGVGKNQDVSQVTTETIDPTSKTKTVTTIKYEQAKNLWDWFSLLGVPISVAFLGWWLQYLQQKRTEEQVKLEKGIAEENQREEVLQAYFDRISTLLIDNNVLAISTKVKNATGSEDEQQALESSDQRELLDAAADVIRARTLSILRRLKNDPVRKASILLFLNEAEVIRKLDIDLRGIDFQGANFHGAVFIDAELERANFEGANFNFANLNRAKLNFANLNRAKLQGADLQGANLFFANLDHATLEDSILDNANLFCANLQGASLIGASLIGASFHFANLQGANLQGANIEDAGFKGANIDGANLQVAIGMTLEKVKQAKNWEKAHYSSDFCKQLGLPSEKSS